MDAYITAAQYTDYATARGLTVNADTLAADLILSADFINTFYNLLDEYKLPGIEPTELAAIEKPALKAVELQQAGRLTLDYAALNAGVIKCKMEKVDVIEEETEYQEGTTPTSKPRVPELDLLMRPFLSLSGQLVKLRV